ncbi:MAG: T9SS type A sorting domain-containing protein, partial [Saprospiraceae bacterium]
VINNSHTSQMTNFNFSGLNITSQINAVRTSATEDWAILPNVIGSGTSFTDTLMPKSITTFTATTNLTTGINSFIADKNIFSVYPNPASDFVKIKFPATQTGTARIELTDVTGRILLSQNILINNIGENIFSINTNSITSSGIYFLNFLTEKKSFASKLIITKN